MAQVLSDGTNAYFYCNRRVGEEQLAGWAYHLPDTLGSVRHLADPSGGLTLAHGLEPAGNTWLRVGYGFAGEWTDGKGLGASGRGCYAFCLGRFPSRVVRVGDPPSGREGQPTDRPSGRMKGQVRQRVGDTCPGRAEAKSADPV